MKLYLTLFLMFILLTIAFIFGSQNEQVITLNYLIAKTSMPVAMAVSIFTMIGFSLGLLTVFIWRIMKPFKRNKNNSEG